MGFVRVSTIYLGSLGDSRGYRSLVRFFMSHSSPSWAYRLWL